MAHLYNNPFGAVLMGSLHTAQLGYRDQTLTPKPPNSATAPIKACLPWCTLNNIYSADYLSYVCNSAATI